MSALHPVFGFIAAPVWGKGKLFPLPRVIAAAAPNGLLLYSDQVQSNPSLPRAAQEQG